MIEEYILCQPLSLTFMFTHVYMHLYVNEHADIYIYMNIYTQKKVIMHLSKMLQQLDKPTYTKWMTP